MIRLLFFPLLLVSISSGLVHAADEHELEPCINGSVSASGMYATQELEDQARKLDTSKATVKKGSVIAETEPDRKRIRGIKSLAQ
ncbi:MAG: hypothetical protein GY792_08220 [Gammaproteobacteria bacterium]|nr:hypothetical protein [Gammaproteobacteria bacterium]